MIFANVKEWYIPEGSVTKVTDSNGDIIWEKESTDYQSMYFYVEDASGEDNTLTIKRNYNYNNNSSGYYNPTINVFKSTNQTDWTRVTNNITQAGSTITIPANGRIYLKADATAFGGYDDDCQREVYSYINCSKRFRVGGNIMSLLYDDDFRTATLYNNANAFEYFFKSSNVVDASNLVLYDANHSLYFGIFDGLFLDCRSLTIPPKLEATTLHSYCYNSMFAYCTHLTTAPELPVTTLAEGCYRGMFRGCSALTTAPELPATEMVTRCYQETFQYCTSLTTAPILPATEMVNYCYAGLFDGCTNLNSITTYATNTNVYNSYVSFWVRDVAESGDFYNLGGARFGSGDFGIPTGWTEHKAEDYSTKYFFVEDASGSDNTFSIVKSNSSAPDVTVYYSTDETNWNTLGTTSTNALTTTIPANGRVYLKATTTRWSSNPSYFTTFSASGNFNVGGNIMSLINGDNFATTTSFTTTPFIFNKLFRNVTTLISAEKLILPVLSLPSHCYYFMFQNCTNLVKAPVELPATTISNEVYSFMFYGCSSLTTAPVLYATNLKNLCFQQMFNGCSNLNYIKMLSLDAPNSTYCQNWVSGVASSGTFVKSSSATWENTFGVNSIPDGWTVETADA